MITSELRTAIHHAVACEMVKAKENHGATYASNHEAVGVLLEEIQEAQDEIDAIKARLPRLIRDCREDSTTPREVLHDLHARAVSAACECVQIAAVCAKAVGGEF